MANERVSLIINTACGDAQVAGKRNPYRQRRYGERAELLLSHVLPLALQGGFDEIIVSGMWPGGLPESLELESVLWLQVPPQRHNRWDGLLQREAGARHATGDLLVFCHDDHAPQPGFADKLLTQIDPAWDILIPRRLHALTREELNNGGPRHEDPPYMGGHCYVMRRWVWAGMPLTSAPDEWWDIWFTPRWNAMGARMVWTDDLVHLDMEAREGER